MRRFLRGTALFALSEFMKSSFQDRNRLVELCKSLSIDEFRSMDLAPRGRHEKKVVRGD